MGAIYDVATNKLPITIATISLARIIQTSFIQNGQGFRLVYFS
jgi:hypothetical protein